MKRTRPANTKPPELQTWVMALDTIDDTKDTGSSFIYLVRETPRRLGKAIIQAGEHLTEAGFDSSNFLVTFISDFNDLVEAQAKYTTIESEYATHSIFDIIQQSEEWREKTTERAAVPFLEFTRDMSSYMHEGITAIYAADKIGKQKPDNKARRVRKPSQPHVDEPEAAPLKVAIRPRHRPAAVAKVEETKPSVTRRVRK